MDVIKGRVGRGSPMGATLDADGTGFRTWAPSASAVAVVIGAGLDAAVQAPGWMPGAGEAMEPLGDGSWGGFSPGIGDGDRYLFFVQGPGGAGWKRDPCARELTSAPAYPLSHGLVRDPASYPWRDAGWHAPAFSDLVIYQLHVGTWWARDAAGADVRATRGGTFLDVVTKLDHLVALGITAIQLLPIQEFETPHSLGYNGTDLFSPEIPYCATPAEVAWRLPAINAALAALGQPPLTAALLEPGVNQLKCLVDLCHLNGIGVVFDQVYNHAFGHDDRGDFDARSLWFYDRQAGKDPNLSLYFTDHVWIGPVFAYWQDWVSQFLIDNAGVFLAEYHADGFRYDEMSAVFNNGGESFARNLAQTIRFARPAAIQIAEYWNGDRARAVLPPPAGLGFDAALADGLRDGLRDLLTQASGGLSVALDLSRVASGLTAGLGESWRLDQCLENHDKTYAGHPDAKRVPALADPGSTRSWYARSRSRAATSLLLTAPGIPSLFMGQEILEDKNWNDSPQYGGLIFWDGLAAPGESSMRDFLRCVGDLVHLRRSQPALRIGGVRVSRMQNFERVLAMHRWVEGEGDDVVVVASFDERPKHGYAVGLPFGGAWREAFNSDVYDIFPNPTPTGNGGWVEASGPPLDGFPASATLTLPANGALVLTRA